MATKTTKKTKIFSLISDETFGRMYSAMTALRTAAKPKAASRGAEAVIAGTTIDLLPADLILAPADLFPASMLIDERLIYFGSLGKSAVHPDTRVFPSISASAVPALAAGAALGRHTAPNDSVIVAFGKPDSAQRDAWLDALRLAGMHRLPILFILLPGDETEAARIGAEAMAAGVISMPVDTADVVAMYRVAFESLARARRRTGATLIVSTEYKLENAKPRRAEDPLKKFELYLKNKGLPIKV